MEWRPFRCPEIINKKMDRSDYKKIHTEKKVTFKKPKVKLEKNLQFITDDRLERSVSASPKTEG